MAGRSVFRVVALVALLAPLGGPVVWAGFDEGLAAETRGDYATAFREYYELAVKGDAKSQFKIGLLYETGDGVERNVATAMEWYQKSADKGYARAQTVIGRNYYEGWYGEKNYSKALIWLRKAVARRVLHEREFEKKFSGGSAKYKQTVTDDGYAPAKYFLGRAYREGLAVRKDPDEAIKWFKQAASQSYAKAYHSLGTMYEKGEGVAPDLAEAIKWYKKGVGKDDARSQFSLGVLYGKQKNYEGSLKLLSRSAEQGNIRAQHAVGLLHYLGMGYPKDYVASYMWFSITASRLPPGKDHKMIIGRRDEVAAAMTSTQIIEAQRLAGEWIAKHRGKN